MDTITGHVGLVAIQALAKDAVRVALHGKHRQDEMLRQVATVLWRHTQSEDRIDQPL